VTLQVSITTPEGLLHKGEAVKVVVPAHDGELGILPRHAALVGALGAGELRVSPAGGSAPLSFFVAGGFVQVLQDRVLVLATQAFPAALSDAAAAEEALRGLLSESLPKDALPAIKEDHDRKVQAAKARVRYAAKKKAAG